MAPSILALLLLGSTANVRDESFTVCSLRCEYLVNPLGVDVTAPRLSWVLRSDVRGQRQTAYRVLVASSPEILNREQGDLWDSGRVVSDQTTQVEYAGKPLSSGLCCYWKARAWDKDGRPSAWSVPALWSMGMMENGGGGSPWKANWISLRPLRAENSLNGRLGHNGFHSRIEKSADVVKWVIIDLGSTQSIDGARLYPTRDYRYSKASSGMYFPVRFRIDVSADSSFAHFTSLVDHSGEDLPNPHEQPWTYAGKAVPGRYVRLWVNKLGEMSGNYAVALAEMEILGGGKVLSANKPVVALDSIDAGAWSSPRLVDGIKEPVPPLATAAQSTASENFEPLLRKTFVIASKPKRAVA
jgi:alpha-L-rhamnosidase